MRIHYENMAKEIIILVGISVILAFVINFFSPKGISLVGQWDESQGVVTARAKDDVVIDDLEIDDVKVAKQIFDGGNVVFVDARSQELYEDGHIMGAVSMPLDQFDERIGEFFNQYPPDTTIITYCSGRTCEDSHNLAQLLLASGYTRVRVFIDGFPGWEAEGYPVE